MTRSYEDMLEYQINGEVKISERGEKDENDASYSSTDLVEKETDVTLVISSPEETEYFCSVNAHGYHVENPETKRVFHGHIRCCLDYAETKRLHAFLGYLLSAGDK